MARLPRLSESDGGQGFGKPPRPLHNHYDYSELFMPTCLKDTKQFDPPSTIITSQPYI